MSELFLFLRNLEKKFAHHTQYVIKRSLLPPRLSVIAHSHSWSRDLRFYAGNFSVYVFLIYSQVTSFHPCSRWALRSRVAGAPRPVWHKVLITVRLIQPTHCIKVSSELYCCDMSSSISFWSSSALYLISDCISPRYSLHVHPWYDIEEAFWLVFLNATPYSCLVRRWFYS